MINYPLRTTNGKEGNTGRPTQIGSWKSHFYILKLIFQVLWKKALDWSVSDPTLTHINNKQNHSLENYIFYWKKIVLKQMLIFPGFWIRIRLDPFPFGLPDPDPFQYETDPKHWIKDHMKSKIHGFVSLFYLPKIVPE